MWGYRVEALHRTDCHGRRASIVQHTPERNRISTSPIHQKPVNNNRLVLITPICVLGAAAYVTMHVAKCELLKQCLLLSFLEGGGKKQVWGQSQTPWLRACCILYYQLWGWNWFRCYRSRCQTRSILASSNVKNPRQKPPGHNSDQKNNN